MHSIRRSNAGQALKSVRAATRSASTDAQPSSSSSSSSQIKASMLINRAPLLTPTQSPFREAYYKYNSDLRLALSNPAPVDFYFKKGSLTERRFLRAQWQREKATFGDKIAGKQPDVGEIPSEEEVKLNLREQEEDVSGPSQEQAKKLERKGEENLYMLVKDKKSGEWSLPTGSLADGEALHETASRTVETQVGENMDLWLVTRKPIGLIEEGSESTFIFKSHILAGAPAPSSSSTYSDYAWLTKEEIRKALGGEAPVEGVNDLSGIKGVESNETSGSSAWAQIEPLLN